MSSSPTEESEGSNKSRKTHHGQSAPSISRPVRRAARGELGSLDHRADVSQHAIDVERASFDARLPIHQRARSGVLTACERTPNASTPTRRRHMQHHNSVEVAGVS